jgi:hypothetical protein
MKRIIATVQVNENEVQLIKELDSYYIYWGEVKEYYKSKQQLLTPSGRKPSQTSAYKKFLQATKAAQYIKFEKL